MDNLHSPLFYKKYEALLSVSSDSRLSEIRLLCDELIAASKEAGYRSTFYRAMAICIIPLMLLSAAVYIKEGISWLHTAVFLASLFVVYRRSTLNRLMRDIKKPSTDMSARQHVGSSISYLRQGLAAKAYRVDTLMLQYCLSFAWIILLAAVLLYGSESNYTQLVWLVVAYLVSTPVWWWFFNKDKQSVMELDKQAALLESAFYALPK